MTADSQKVVTCDMTFDVTENAEVILQIVAAGSSGTVLAEKYEICLDGEPITSKHQLAGPHQSRIQVVTSGSGDLVISYRAEIGVAAAPQSNEPDPQYSDEFSQIMYERPSRYCPSDHLVGFALSEFAADSDVHARVKGITEWIRQRIAYLPGSGTVHDTAEDTLLTCTGTCRDFAHLGVALCRAVGIAARFTSVYAPGLSPMDFHAVFETLQDGRWYVHDATGLAPRQAMVRIATGRDAADTAFASVTRGTASLMALQVSATTGGTLPVDDGAFLIELA